MSSPILMIEDDYDIVASVEHYFRSIGLEVSHAADGAAGLERALTEDFALVLLDLALPEMDGIEVCKKIREQKKALPILMLTSRSEEIDKVVGLEVGADDYVTKPFSVRELAARVKATIRRIDEIGKTLSREAGGPGMRNFAGLEIDFEKRTVRLHGQDVDLTALQYDVLSMLAASPGKPFTREEIVEQVWGFVNESYNHALVTLISRLRVRLEPDPNNPKYIETVRGVGYRFADIAPT